MEGIRYKKNIATIDQFCSLSPKAIIAFCARTARRVFPVYLHAVESLAVRREPFDAPNMISCTIELAEQISHYGSIQYVFEQAIAMTSKTADIATELHHANLVAAEAAVRSALGAGTAACHSRNPVEDIAWYAVSCAKYAISAAPQAFDLMMRDYELLRRAFDNGQANSNSLFPCSFFGESVITILVKGEK